LGSGVKGVRVVFCQKPATASPFLGGAWGSHEDEEEVDSKVPGQ